MSETTRRRTTYRPEALSLEGRSLLSAGLSAGRIHAAQAVVHGRPVVPGPATPISFFKAQATGVRASDGLYTPAPAGYASFSGTGHAFAFGPMLFGTQFKPTAVSANQADLTNGSAVLTFLKGGNQLRLEFTGTSTAGKFGQVWNLAGNVVGGTGRFNFATGTFTAVGAAAHGQGFRVDFQITLNPPA